MFPHFQSKLCDEQFPVSYVIVLLHWGKFVERKGSRKLKDRDEEALRGIGQHCSHPPIARAMDPFHSGSGCNHHRGGNRAVP